MGSEKENIDTYAFKDTMTGGGGKSRFDFYASASFASFESPQNKEAGFHLFKLNVI